MRYIPYGRQHISAEDIAAVVETLQSDFLTQGPAVERFERDIAKACGTEFAMAANSATSILHIACLALGVGPGDVVWTSPITFVASANCALYCGADVDFVDVDPATFNMSVSALGEKLERAAVSGRLPKVVIPVHMCGQSCDMAGIAELAARYGFKVIEDASHAVGGRYQGASIGSCAYSNITVFSFHPVKIITTAEGGMAMTNDPVLARSMARLRSHGITRDPAEMTGQPDGPWAYEQIELGYNYRLTDLQAALGSSQVVHLAEWVEKRHAIARKYDEAFAGLPLRTPVRTNDGYSAFHLYVVLLEDDAPLDREALFSRLRDAGIGVNVHYMPVYLQPYYRGLGFQAGYCPAAEDYYRRCISLPMYASLTDDDQDYVIDTVRDALAK